MEKNTTGKSLGFEGAFRETVLEIYLKLKVASEHITLRKESDFIPLLGIVEFLFLKYLSLFSENFHFDKEI